MKKLFKKVLLPLPKQYLNINKGIEKKTKFLEVDEYKKVITVFKK